MMNRDEDYHIKQIIKWLFEEGFRTITLYCSDEEELLARLGVASGKYVVWLEYTKFGVVKDFIDFDHLPHDLKSDLVVAMYKGHKISKEVLEKIKEVGWRWQTM